MAEAHTQRAHAKLAPSSAHRWMSCPGSIRMSEGIPNTSSIFAAEGTAAHELCAHCLETGDNPATYAEMWVDLNPEDPTKRFVDFDETPEDQMRYFLIDEDMVDAVTIYVDHVRALVRSDDDLLSVEQRLDMTHLHPAIFGTGDATVMQTAEKHLHVVDFKYGKGVAVDADDNPQLLLYAAGAAHRHHNHQIENLTMHVVQPRADHKAGAIRSFAIDLIDLLEFESDIRAGARKTEEATAAYPQASIAPWAETYLAAGEWCRFCPALAICPAARKNALKAAVAEFGEIGDELVFTDPKDLTEDKLALVLKEADQAFNYIKAVQQHAHDMACAGKMPTGYKLVAKRATRKWKDEDAAEEHLTVLGVSKNEIFTEPKLKTPAQLEKFFPGSNKEKRQAAMADLVDKKSSGTNLVPVSDPRPPVNLGASAEFEVVDGAD